MDIFLGRIFEWSGSFSLTRFEDVLLALFFQTAASVRVSFIHRRLIQRGVQQDRVADLVRHGQLLGLCLGACQLSHVSLDCDFQLFLYQDLAWH